MIASFYVGERFRTIVETVGGQAFVSLAGVLVTFTISWLLLLLAYTVVPDARVRLRPALAGAFVAAVLWETGKFAFREYLGFATGYSQFYGSLALIPIFLLWVYITWVCVLFGIQLSQARLATTVASNIMPPPPPDRDCAGTAIAPTLCDARRRRRC